MHHFYHCYTAGNWERPLVEHCRALTEYGLYDELDTLNIGFVGSALEISPVMSTLDILVPNWQECARAETGWEQITLEPLYDFVQDHAGPVSYAHTKGSSRNDPIDEPWRRMMTYHNFVDWRRPIAALDAGYAIAGCYWLPGATPSGDSIKWVNGVPSGGTSAGGIFGGNFWWTTCELLRQNFPPGNESRHAAEHWLGQVSNVIPLNAETIYNMQAFPIGDEPPVAWWRERQIAR